MCSRVYLVLISHDLQCDQLLTDIFVYCIWIIQVERAVYSHERAVRSIDRRSQSPPRVCHQLPQHH